MAIRSYALKIALQKLQKTTQKINLHEFSAKHLFPNSFNAKYSAALNKMTILNSTPVCVQCRLSSYIISTDKTLDEGKPSISGIEDSKDAETICRILIDQHNPFHVMEGALQLNGINITADIVYQVLLRLRLRNASKVALGFFVWAKEQVGYHHSVSAYNVMIDMLGKVRQFDVAWQLIIEMGQIFPQVGVKSFSILIRRYAAAGMATQAIRAFDDMESFLERDPSSEDFKMLLDTLCKYGFSRLATELFNKRKAQFTPDTKTYNILIYGWCKRNKSAIARNLLNEMINQGCEPSVVTYNVLLEDICGKNKLLESRFCQMKKAAENLLVEMKSRGFLPDVMTYSILMHAYGRALKAEECFRLLNEMKENCCSPNVVTYTCVIKCLCILGRMNEAYILLDEMVQDGVYPSAITYNCFLKVFGGRNDGDKALELYKKMQEAPLTSKPTNQTYHILLRMFCRLDRMDVVFDIWNDMHQKGNGPDLDSYTLLIHSLIEKAKWREACLYFVQMIEKGLLPQTVTFETLYKGLIQSDQLRSWRRLKNKLADESKKFKEEFEGYHFKPYQR
ncbi:hypothetical protein SUGI_0495210 [Cryptomeria japonica]|uniref:pentatricopeptide repeat-containing protein At2g13420, mitochondrial n=1 Tax=Cryptomeria japonica TaxID=3369 RepID=UPI0024089D2F|nr:pentatricopeptide repeat-containing protein At2g13420, mitochondrial [Cryptomeria japonica]GLJ25846.1 hypothetical protein SUGI_0495210 [Cryptomeria japonica]